MSKNFYYDAECVLNKSLLVWIKSQTMTLKESVLYLLESYNKTKEEINEYVKNIEQTLSNWNIFIDATGMRLAYNPKIVPDHAKRLILKDIYDITVVEANSKNIV